jgi:CP family cyanate transporter-like MFS transporter
MSQCGGYVIGAMGPLLIGVIYDRSGSFLPALLAMLVFVVVMIGVQLLITSTKKEVQVNG